MLETGKSRFCCPSYTERVVCLVYDWRAGVRIPPSDLGSAQLPFGAIQSKWKVVALFVVHSIDTCVQFGKTIALCTCTAPTTTFSQTNWAPIPFFLAKSFFLPIPNSSSCFPSRAFPLLSPRSTLSIYNLLTFKREDWKLPHLGHIEDVCFSASSEYLYVACRSWVLWVLWVHRALHAPAQPPVQSLLYGSAMASMQIPPSSPPFSICPPISPPSDRSDRSSSIRAASVWCAASTTATCFLSSESTAKFASPSCRTGVGLSSIEASSAIRSEPIPSLNSPSRRGKRRAVCSAWCGRRAISSFIISPIVLFDATNKSMPNLRITCAARTSCPFSTPHNTRPNSHIQNCIRLHCQRYSVLCLVRGTRQNVALTLQLAHRSQTHLFSFKDGSSRVLDRAILSNDQPD